MDWSTFCGFLLFYGSSLRCRLSRRWTTTASFSFLNLTRMRLSFDSLARLSSARHGLATISRYIEKLQSLKHKKKLHWVVLTHNNSGSGRVEGKFNLVSSIMLQQIQRGCTRLAKVTDDELKSSADLCLSTHNEAPYLIINFFLCLLFSN